MTYYDMCIQVLSGALMITYLLVLGVAYQDLEMLSLAAVLYRFINGHVAQ